MTLAPPWLEVAIDEMGSGVVEVRGDSHNDRIVDYHQATSLRATEDEVPWCSSFVNWCMKRADFPTTNSARARSWLKWGMEVPFHPAPYGAVTILSRGGGDQPGPDVIDAPGHVGFLVGTSGPREILILGGNQSDQVCIRPYSVDRVLGYRWHKTSEAL